VPAIGRLRKVLSPSAGRLSGAAGIRPTPALVVPHPYRRRDRRTPASSPFPAPALTGLASWHSRCPCLPRQRSIADIGTGQLSDELNPDLDVDQVQAAFGASVRIGWLEALRGRSPFVCIAPLPPLPAPRPALPPPLVPDCPALATTESGLDHPPLPGIVAAPDSPSSGRPVLGGGCPCAGRGGSGKRPACC
jgi:hypothetical protein